MKKLVLGAVLLASLLLVLSACANGKQDKMQGEWQADNDMAENYIGKKMKIEGDKVKVSGKGDNGTDIKYFNFKDDDDDESKYIRFYTAEPNDDDFDKKDPTLEGDVEFGESDEKFSVKVVEGMTFDFKKA